MVAESFEFKRGFKSNSEKISLDYRKTLGLQQHEPLSACDLANHLKIKIVTPKNIFPAKSESLRILSTSNNWSALTMPCKSGSRIIILNDKHSKARQESDLMHEIAHVILNHETSSSKKLDGFDILLRDYNEEQEKEAEWLGACLQLPRYALLYHLNKNHKTQEISVIFNASEQMVKYRINSTGVKKQYSYMH